LFDALAFLHGEHPLYKDKPEFQPPRTTVVLDIKEDNIFFKWPQERIEHYYPDLKLGDFGSCVHLPVGGQRESDLYNVVSEPPEYMISAKYDVWCGGSMIFYMAKLAERPNVELPFYMANTSRNRELLRQDPNRIKQQIDDHYTGWLEEDIKFTLTMDPNKRPTAWEVVEKIRSGAQKRRALPYIPLPDWVHLDSFMEHKFDPAIVASIEVEGESGDPRRAEINADARLRRQMPDRLGRINEEQVNWYEKSVHVNKNELQEADTAELFIERRPLRRTRKFRAYRPL
jgi:serine/threonine protein kinase